MFLAIGGFLQGGRRCWVVGRGVGIAAPVLTAPLGECGRIHVIAGGRGQPDSVPRRIIDSIWKFLAVGLFRQNADWLHRRLPGFVRIYTLILQENFAGVRFAKIAG